MNVLILRHANAVIHAPSDKERVLCQTGKLQLEKMSARFSSELKDIDKVFLSPYVRTQQTLEQLTQFVPCLKNIDSTITPLLEPNANIHGVIELIVQAQMQSANKILLISHQPLVSHLVDSLCHFEPGYHFMGTAALASIQFDVVALGCGSLNWMAQPE